MVELLILSSPMTISIFFWKSSRWLWRKWSLMRMLLPSTLKFFKSLLLFIRQFWCNFLRSYFQESLNKFTRFLNKKQTYFENSVFLLMKYLSQINCQICSLSNTYTFIFSKRRVWKFRNKILKIISFSGQNFYELLH